MKRAALLTITWATVAACDGSQINPLPADGGIQGGSLVKGFGLSPFHFPIDYSKLADFYTEVGAQPDSGVMWNGAWRDDAFGGSDAGTVPAAAQALIAAAPANHFSPITVFGWRSGNTLLITIPGSPTNDWSNQAARSTFQSMLVRFVKTSAVPFVFLGNENDFYYEESPTDYANWISAYNSTYTAIKAASPGTLVGPVFNVEHMSGKGVLNGWSKPLWQAIDAHDMSKVDVIGITLYPFFAEASASSVPVSYLDELLTHTQGKPIAITETGWPAENLGGLDPTWETSPAAQVTYLASLGALLHGKNVKLVDWLFLNAEVDPTMSLGWKLFGSISLRDMNGAERPAYATWRTFAP